MKTKIISLSFLFLLILSSIALAHAQTSLNLTVTTNQTTADFYTPVTLSGTVSYNSEAPSDALIGLQVLYPTGGLSMILRTIQTGTVAEFTEPENIASAFSSTGSGSPVAAFYTGVLGYFTMSIANQDHQTRTVLIAISIYDASGVPLGLSTSQVSVGADASQLQTVSIPIPTTAHSGTAYGYADVYTDFPQNGGYPLAQEYAFTFQIVGGPSGTGSPPSNSGSAGVYSMTFTLPQVNNAQSGIYHVFASGTWSGEYGVASTSFNLQLLGDFNGDGVVNSADFFIFLSAYIASNTGQSYNTACDLGNYGKINANDFFLFLSDYITYWSS